MVYEVYEVWNAVWSAVVHNISDLILPKETTNMLPRWSQRYNNTVLEEMHVRALFLSVTSPLYTTQRYK